jgi:hypothetical protein
MRKVPFSILLALLLSACVAQSGARKAVTTAKLPTSGPAVSSGATSTARTLTITAAEEVLIQQKKNIRLYFRPHEGTSLSTTNVDSFCPTSSVTCQCIFRWNETNTTTPGTSITSDAQSLTFERRAITPVINSQAALADCELPSVYPAEIGVGEEVRISVEPVSDSALFQTNSYTFTKPGLNRDSSATGFEDSQGNIFNDVWRYVCHENIRRGVAFSSQTSTVTRTPPFNAGGGYSETLGFGLASRFSVESAIKSDGRLSAQLNYFNLYAAANRLIVNPDNKAFSCPQVASQRIRPAASSSPEKLYFPFDSTFSLASKASKTFNIPIEARSRLSSTSPDSSTHNYCDQKNKSGDSLGDSSVVIDCLGYAASPRGNGTCPNITVRLQNADGTYKRENGQIKTEVRPTYRLRRFTALYPAMYDTSGAWISNYQAKADQIYVLDRPAVFSTSSGPVAGSILGPKPCPFAWWDWSSALTPNTVGYYSTNDDRWKGKNPDGIHFPVDHVSGESCPAAMPYRTADGKFLIKSLVRNDRGQIPEEAQIRPIQNPWEPVYWEDKAFLACAPEDEPTTRVRAPLHHRVSSNGSNASYCEEIYPTEHLGVSTTHLTSRSTISSSCSGSSCEHFPLLAPISGIETALENTSNYGCQATYAPGTSLVSNQGFATVGGAARCCNNFSFGTTFGHSTESSVSTRCDWN